MCARQSFSPVTVVCVQDIGLSARMTTTVLARAAVEGRVLLTHDVSTLEGPQPVWVVVDYKTDAEVAARREEYENQIRTYARAVGSATGERVRGVLLRV
jgi:hypothetical protein